jgi:hypothetical protein
MRAFKLWMTKQTAVHLDGLDRRVHARDRVPRLRILAAASRIGVRAMASISSVKRQIRASTLGGSIVKLHSTTVPRVSARLAPQLSKELEYFPRFSIFLSPTYASFLALPGCICPFSRRQGLLVGSWTCKQANCFNFPLIRTATGHAPNSTHLLSMTKPSLCLPQPYPV